MVVLDLAEDEEAVERYPELAGLVLIRDAGWRFVHHYDASGDVTCIDGYYQWPGGRTDAEQRLAGVKPPSPVPMMTRV